MKSNGYDINGKVFTMEGLGDFITRCTEAPASRNGKKGNIYNVAASFDIETTSFYMDSLGRTYDYAGEQQQGREMAKCATMYIWQFGFNGMVIYGRTWQQFAELCDNLCDALELSTSNKLIVYVHNLSFEFQWLRKRFDWEKVFSIDLRKPIYALARCGIEFRCSYLLSGYSLAKLSDTLHRHRVSKMVGDLDYDLLRHTATPLTEKELGYCINDVRVVMAFIQEQIEDFNGIKNVPLTKTGYVRKYCRAHTLHVKNSAGKDVTNWNYKGLMRCLQISGMEEFMAMHRAFQGGFTHANAKWAGQTLHDVTSYDFTSSYPAVMVAEQYPMSQGTFVQVKSPAQFSVLLDKYCCIFDIEFTDIFACREQDNPISISKCWLHEEAATNNGRVIGAKRLAMTITDVDYRVLCDFYDWADMKVGGMWCYKRGYLPTEFVGCILDLYAKKTTLKGVKGRESEYMNSKEMLNSCYGMCVTNPLRDEILYLQDSRGEQWVEKSLDVEEKSEMLFKYNNSENRFLFYPWGVFVTAYARRNLFSAIKAVGNDYVYSDTDSCKLLHADKHQDYFKRYNNEIQAKLRTACAHHHLPIDMVEPRTIKGVNKPLGAWDYDGHYTTFKTLGAKRYMTETAEDGLSVTISGVNKKDAVLYLLKEYGTAGAFEAFTDLLDIPASASGKKLHTYIDYPLQCELVDYNGQSCSVGEQSGVHLEPTSYTLNMAILYLNHLRGVQFIE